MSNAVAMPVEKMPMAPAASVASSPMLSLLSDAIQRGMDIDVIREIKAMAKEMAADEARRAFDAAMSDAKAEIPVILKNREVGYDHKSGDGKTSYRHEDLGEIARTVDPILAKYGLSYRFRTSSEPNQPVVVTCIVAHRAGHSEENTLSAGRDESGKKNSIQAIASTITYLQRYTLKAALGLAASADDDGNSADKPAAITEEQRNELLSLIDAKGVDIARFCSFLEIDALSNLGSDRFEDAKRALINKKAAR